MQHFLCIVASSFVIGSIIGSIIGGFQTKYLGRKYSMMVDCVITLAGLISIRLANSFAQESKGENFDEFKGRPKNGYKLTTGLMKEPYRNSAQVGGDF